LKFSLPIIFDWLAKALRILLQAAHDE